MRSPSHTPPWTPPPVTSSPSDDRESELKLLTLWNQGVPPPFATLDDGPAFETKNLCRATHNPERWWVVTISAIEALRISEQPLPPLSRGELTRSPSAVPSSLLRARIVWGRTGQGHAVDVDVGSGIRLAIEGQEVDVKIVGPRGRMREVAKGDQRPIGEPGVGGMVLDSLVTGMISPSPGPPSARCPTLTQVISVSPGMADRSVHVPPFARRLTVTRSGFAALGPLSFRVGVTGPELRQIFMDPRDPGSTPTVLVPQSATHITTGPALIVPRVFVFQWELDL